MTNRRTVLVLLLVFAATLPLLNPYLRGDGIGYYAWVRSAVLDGDLDFHNEYRRGEPSFLRGVFFRGDIDNPVIPNYTLPNGLLRNHWALGPALLWLPFFSVAHAGVLAARALGAGVAADGFSAPYLWLCALATALYGFLSLVLGYSLARRYAAPAAALVAALGVWFASSLPVYMYFLPFQAHAAAAFSVALFFWYGVRTRERRTLAQWAVWGATVGLMGEVYFVNAVFLAFFAAELIRTAPTAGVRRTVAAATAGAAAALLVMLPHFFTRWYLYGSPFVTGYVDNFFWSSPRLWQVGFSAEHGLFSWTPLLLVAVLGWALLWRPDRWLAGSAIAGFAVFYYVVASHKDWHGYSSFGNRFFISFTPLFVVGLALVVERAAGWLERVGAAGRLRALGRSGRRRYAAVATVVALLAVWNLGFIFQWGTNIVPNRGPVDFAEVARNQATVVPRRILDVGLRYLADRRGVTERLEQEDLQEVHEFTAER